MRSGVDRPGYDAWVGVGAEVLRYVRALETEIESAGVKSEIANREHADELKRLRNVSTFLRHAFSEFSEYPEASPASDWRAVWVD